MLPQDPYLGFSKQLIFPMKNQKNLSDILNAIYETSRLLLIINFMVD